MPKYDYRCTSCGTVIELTHSVHDAKVRFCPECTVGQLKKIFNPTPVHFKGKGFYRTDK